MTYKLQKNTITILLEANRFLYEVKLKSIMMLLYYEMTIYYNLLYLLVLIMGNNLPSPNNIRQASGVETS